MAKGKKKQGYTNAAGVVVPSVTTVIGRFKDSGPLLFWAFKKGKGYGEEAMQAIVGDIVSDATYSPGATPEILGSIAQKAVAAAIGSLSSHKLYDDTDAVDAGTVAHDLVENFIKTGEDGRDTVALRGSYEAVEKGKGAFNTFLKWWEMTHIEFFKDENGNAIVEEALVSEKHQYGGKLDAVGIIGNELVLLDWKTSNGVYLDYTIQLAAYGMLWEEIHPEHPMTGGFHLLRFAKEEGDFAHHHFPNLDTEKVLFLKYREAYDLAKRCEKRVK